jgi:putative nucleotidyltransferase with HDIG domain
VTALTADIDPTVADHLSEMDRRLLETAHFSLGLRDPYTAQHSRRVALYALHMAREIGLDSPSRTQVFISAWLHDIGKLAFEDDFFYGPRGHLTSRQMAQVRQHPIDGADYLIAAGYRGAIVDFVRWHHERLDGTGYPHGIKGDRIPIGAQVISLVDSFDALTTDRPYQKRRGPHQALHLLRAGSGHRYDSALIEVLAGKVSSHIGAVSLQQGILARPGGA